MTADEVFLVEDSNLGDALTLLFGLSLEELVNEFPSNPPSIDIKEFFPVDISYYYLKFLIMQGIKIGSHVDRYRLMEYVGNFIDLSSANTQINWALETLNIYGAEFDIENSVFGNWWFTLPKEDQLDRAYELLNKKDFRQSQIRRRKTGRLGDAKSWKQKEWWDRLATLPKIEDKKYDDLFGKLIKTTPVNLGLQLGIHLAVQDITRKDMAYLYLSYFASQGFDGCYISKSDMIKYFQEYESVWGSAKRTVSSRVTEILRNYSRKGLDLQIEGIRFDTWIRVPNQLDLKQTYDMFSDARNLTTKGIPAKPKQKKKIKKKVIKKVVKKTKREKKPKSTPPPKIKPIPLAQIRLDESIDTLLRTDPIVYAGENDILYRKDDKLPASSLIYIFMKGLLRNGVLPGTVANIDYLSQYLENNSFLNLDPSNARSQVFESMKFYRSNGLELKKNRSEFKVPTHFQLDSVYLQQEFDDEPPNSIGTRMFVKSQIESLPNNIVHMLRFPLTIPEISWVLRNEYNRHSLVVQEVPRVITELKIEKQIYAKKGLYYAN